PENTTLPTTPAPATGDDPAAPRGRRGRSGRRAAPSWAASRLAANLLTYAFLVAGALLMLGPFVFSVLTAVKTPHQFNTSWPLTLPDPVTGENFATLFSAEYSFVVAVAVSVQVGVVVGVGQ